MTVLDMIRKEFNVDENRTYLMGHSMGGAGSIYLGVKHASIWAAVGAEAPATAPAGLTPDTFSLEPAKKAKMSGAPVVSTLPWSPPATSTYSCVIFSSFIFSIHRRAPATGLNDLATSSSAG